MNEKRITIRWKIIYGIVIFGVMISSVSPGIMPAAGAQAVADATPRVISASLQEAIKSAIASHKLDPTYDYYYEPMEIVEQGGWGLAIAEQILKETGEVTPGNPSMILCHKDRQGNWRVVLPNQDAQYLDLLNTFPETLLDTPAKETIRDAYEITAQALFSDHYLPWTKGTRAVVIRNYSEHGKGQVDLGFSGDIRTTKPGTLIFAYDAHTWNKCDGQTLTWCNAHYKNAWYYNNALVIKHADGEYSAYLHMQANSIPDEIIKNCDNGNGGKCSPVSIPVGTKIGVVGSNGQSTNPHLHYGTGSRPYGRCDYKDFDDEDGDGSKEDLTCTGGIDGGDGGIYWISTDFHEIPYKAPNCGTGPGQDPKLCMLYYPDTAPGPISQNPSSGPIGVPTLKLPAGAITDRTPTYEWSALTSATKYHLQLYRGETLVYEKIYNSTVCSGNLCQAAPDDKLPDSVYKWRLRAYGGGSWNPWSAYKKFAVTGGFDSQFTNGDFGWTPLNGKWGVSTSGLYHSAGVPNTFTSTMHSNNYATLTYTVRMKGTGCAHCGIYIYFRGSPSPLSTDNRWNNAYVLEYANSGYFWIGITENGVPVTLIDWTYSPVITGNWNTLKVTAKGTFIQFFINGRRLAYGNLSNFKTGQVGIGFWKDPGTDHHLYVDWATLSISAPGADAAGEGTPIDEQDARVTPDAMEGPRLVP